MRLVTLNTGNLGHSETNLSDVIRNPSYKWQKQVKNMSHVIVGLPLDHFGEDEQLFVDAAVAKVVVAEEAVEPVVAVILNCVIHKFLRQQCWITFP